MRRTLMVVAALAGGASCGGSTANVPRMRMTPKTIFDEASPAIVRVDAGNDKVGTGFILDKAGIIATNLHVVAGEAEINVRMHDGTKYKVMQVAGLDPGRDLALLKIQPTQTLPTVRLGDSNSLGAGDQVFSISNPLGVFDNSITQGLVSSVRVLCTDDDVKARIALIAKAGRTPDDLMRDLAAKHDEDSLRVLNCPRELTLLQISAAISKGSSGGPLFNQFGEVVGVTTLIVAQGQSINFAIPAKYLKPLMSDRPGAMKLAEFAAATREADKADEPDSNISITRQVPRHPVSVWDGCTKKDVEEVLLSIDQAIEIGAPAYNKMTAQGFEECYRIYEGTALKFEKDAPCKGVREAFGDGLLRANAMASYKEKAWAMRDTFDGLIDVASRWAKANHVTP